MAIFIIRSNSGTGTRKKGYGSNREENVIQSASNRSETLSRVKCDVQEAVVQVRDLLRFGTCVCVCVCVRLVWNEKDLAEGGSDRLVVH